MAAVTTPQHTATAATDQVAMAIAEDSAKKSPARRVPRVWALIILLIALVAAGATALAAVRPRSGTIADQPEEAQFESRADTAVVSRDWRFYGANRGTHVTAWCSLSVQLSSILPVRSAVTWSLTAGAISGLESPRSLSLNRRPWLPIAIITGRSARTASQYEQQA
eukprot:COSAG02_NODE_18136_length_958_cov_1.852154_1_plen_166_part_00